MTQTRDFLDRHANRIVQIAECGCMIWMGELNNQGYGRIAQGGRNRRKRRLVHREVIGAPDGTVVRHSCHTPCCVNPAHLSLGTQKDNAADMVKAGRARGQTPANLLDEARRRVTAGEAGHAVARDLGLSGTTVNRAARDARRPRNRGGSHPEAVLNEQAVRFIRERVAAGEKQNAVARDFNVTPQAVHRIVKRQGWKHVQ